ncbi:transcription factor bHLH96-like isoform X1 [Eucalyptus grandis]|uniref:transcription factor bHLH96-like isoform X1 n=1 Tax=Eucalyptus grandis TaxID=71139 RepID=UPI00192EA86D|nr:transcription factor bHLH96-like isoform X1 [Eucalyptus grandis]
MALEAVVFPDDPFNYYNCKEVQSLLGECWSFDFGDQEQCENSHFLSTLEIQTEDHECSGWNDQSNVSSKALIDRPKRCRYKRRKNKKEMESQRMAHIATERNRRKQMNEHLSVLRSLMPDSHVQKYWHCKIDQVDQASIIGGAINYVKELEQQLQQLGAHKEMEGQSSKCEDDISSPPFSEFFTCPQYSASPGQGNDSVPMNEWTSLTQSAIADIEVTMVETHANLKVRSKRRPKQLLRLVSGLQSVGLTVLHLNVTTAEPFVLYCLTLKVEDGCQMTSGDEIAAAANQILSSIQE